MFLSDTGQFLTLQAHPEMTSSIANSLVDRGDSSYLADSGLQSVSEIYKKLERCHDGEMVFARAMKWGLGPYLNV